MNKIVKAIVPFVLAGAAVFFISGCHTEDNDTAEGNVPALSGTVSIAPDSIEAGTLLTATYSGEEEVTFQWKKGGDKVGEASKTNPNTYTPEEMGIYTVTVSFSGRKSKISNPVIVKDDSRSILGGTVSISPDSASTGNRLTATYSGSEAVTFQWKRDGINIGIASKTKPNIYTPVMPGNYTVTVSMNNYKPISANAVTVTLTTPQYQGNAHNPIITSIYSADPSAHVWPSHPDRLFLYPSQDVFPAPSGFDTMDRYHVFSTNNMLDWIDHGEIIRRDDLADLGLSQKNPTNMYMWAPDAFYYDGTPDLGPYFFIFGHSPNPSGVSGQEWNYWTVFIADSNSPYKDFKNSVRILKDSKGDNVTGGHMYDPCVFADDGKYYVVLGGGNVCHIAELDVANFQLKEPWRRFTQSQLPHYNEGPWMFTRVNDFGEKIYYVMYAGKHDGISTGSDNQGYATADNVYGPWTYRGSILDKVSGDWTSHGSIVQFKEKWYLFYHNAKLSNNTGNLRSACVDELFFNPDGSIQKVEQTATSVPAVGPPLTQAAVTAEFGDYGKIEVKYPDLESESNDFSGLEFNKRYPAMDSTVIVGGLAGVNDPNGARKNVDGNGAVEYMNASGAYAEWTKISGGASGGRAALKLDYANEGSSLLLVTVNGEVIRRPLSVPTTGGWRNYSEGGFYLINLQPGDGNTIRFEGGGVNIKAVLIYHSSK